MTKNRSVGVREVLNLIIDRSPLLPGEPGSMERIDFYFDRIEQRLATCLELAKAIEDKTEPLDHVVIRFDPDLPEDAIPAEFDGMWVDVTQLTKDYSFDPSKATVMGRPAAMTDRTEAREDGTRARVCEVQPTWAEKNG
jgi:hypothetical protein